MSAFLVPKLKKHGHSGAIVGFIGDGTRLCLQEQTRTPEAAEGERHGRRESIQLLVYRIQKLDSGFCPQTTRAAPE